MEEIFAAALSGITAVLVWYGPGWSTMCAKRKSKKSVAEDDKSIVDGRTQREWYEIISSIGKEAAEDLMQGILEPKVDKDGTISLVRDSQYGWDPARLMGHEYWKTLSRAWWPERYCQYCRSIIFNGYEGCNKDCPPWLDIRQREADEILKRELAKAEEKRWKMNAKPISATQKTYVDNLGNKWTRTRMGDTYRVRCSKGGFDAFTEVPIDEYPALHQVIFDTLSHSVQKQINKASPRRNVLQ